MRRAWVLVAGGAAVQACLFPSLDDLTSSPGDASIDVSDAGSGADVAVDAQNDGPSPSDTGAKDAGGSDAFVASIGCGNAQSNLLAYYTFDEGSGAVVNDCISKNNVGNVLNPTHTAWVSGEHGDALELDTATNLCVTVDFATPTFTFGGTSAAPFSVTMWIDLLAFPAQGEIGYIIGQSSDPSTAGWRFSVGPSGALLFSIPNGSGGIATLGGPTLTTGAWHNLVLVYGGATSAIYLDVTNSNASSLPTGFAADVSTDHMRIGCSSDNQHQLNARVDEVRFYDFALSPADVAVVKNAQ